MSEEQIFEWVAAEIERQKISKSELARQMNIHHTTLQGMYRRKSIPIHRLLQLCEILDYNFFQDIANQLEISEPLPLNNDQQEMIAGLQNTIQDLRVKVNLLEEIYAKTLQAFSGNNAAG